MVYRRLVAAPGITLDLIDLALPLDGYHDFFGIWLLRDEKRGITAIVDVGPASTVPLLLDELEKLEVRGLDHILLTHIHLDHSGGLAEVIKAFPGAKVAVHPKGKRHLADPERLWNSSLEVIPVMARIYGKPTPVEEGFFLPEPFDIPGISAIDTPGHAPHHRSFLYATETGGILFAGEAASTFNYLGDTGPDQEGRKYLLRPASPPKFYIEQALSSIERLKAAEASIMCYAHFGHTSEPGRMLQEAGDQIRLWRELFLEYLAIHGSTSAHEVDIDELLAFIIGRDPWLSAFYSLPEDMQSREMGFMTSSATGFLEAVLD